MLLLKVDQEWAIDTNGFNFLHAILICFWFWNHCLPIKTKANTGDTELRLTPQVTEERLVATKTAFVIFSERRFQNSWKYTVSYPTNLYFFISAPASFRTKGNVIYWQCAWSTKMSTGREQWLCLVLLRYLQPKYTISVVWIINSALLH